MYFICITNNNNNNMLFAPIWPIVYQYTDLNKPNFLVPGPFFRYQYIYIYTSKYIRIYCIVYILYGL